MNFSDLFARLGQGFGIVKAMKAVTERIEEVRVRVGTGVLDANEARLQERYLMGRLGMYVNDSRWDRIVELKDAGRVEEARELAAKLRKEYEL
jgi:hypothetical protein